MTYAIEVKRSAQKDLASLPEVVRRRVTARIDKLADDPRPHDSVALKGKRRGYLRVRVGDYRIVYAVDDRAQTVAIVNVGPRESIYT